MQDPSIPGPPPAAGGGGSVSGARCAVHPELPADAVCARCGNYMCSTCSEQGSSKHCAECRARPDASSFPFSRDRYSLEGLIDFSLKRWKAHWLTLSLAVLIFVGITYAITMAGAFSTGLMPAFGGHADKAHAAASTAILVGTQILQIFMQIWMQLGLFALLIDTLQGREPNLGTLFSRSGKLLSALGQLGLIYLGIVVLLLPFFGIVLIKDQATQIKVGGGVALLELIPFAYIGIGLVFSQIELAYNPDAGAISAMRTSLAMVSGHRWRVLGMILVFGLFAGAGALACCVGVIPSLSLAMTMSCALFLALRTPTTA
jgi:hypothetical protein